MRLVILTLLLSVHGLSQDRRPAALSSPITNGRFEIVQSPMAAQYTFKLDRVRGQVWQHVESKGESLWEPMLVVPPPDVSTGTLPRFQIMLSGIVARDSFLIDSQTGSVWILTSGGWEGMKDIK
jgi:hypothetical protein